MKPALTRILIVLAALSLSACASLLGPRDVEFPLAKLQASLNNKFPFNNRYLALFDVNVSKPKLALQPDTNRVVTTMDASIAPPFMKSTWQGSFTISSALQFDAARNAIVLVDPRMEKMEMAGIDPGYSRQIAKLGGLLAEEILNGATLYTVPPEQLRYAGVSFLPSKISARSDSLVVTFDPVK
ncbi:MAG: DUF1439 domain-containing protein [Candidatus Handelsmanbacteria bacterium RIFCSPLOWO2_12_FULL_64_10]|uniref:DUF1439 domain-containing protein n=1 Tax=Handelsmanbacteria sp. (strain RIFCSPLOWO2_12_FULL_64_10) TaxID=1817868 RepID=A0A1F6C4R3_HANXR|nr:MAG: DUF1439 domain-containing protein [Candidatus Handelsmanbacteria bacterium RIFCSPLOWO2_12_FULL_64_10]